MAKDNRKGIVAVIIVAILVVSAVIVVAGANPSPAPSSSYTITDAMNRNINVSKGAEKIVSVAPMITEMAYSLGLQDRLVGVTEYDDYPHDEQGLGPAETHDTIGGFYTPSVENITNAKPDLVLILEGVPYNNDGAKFLSQLEKLNLTVIVLHDPSNINDVYANIILMGKATKTENKAEQLVSQMEARFATIQDAIGPKVDPLKVSYIVWMSPLFVTGGDNYINEIINLSGADNVFEDLTAWAQPSMETMLMRQPDVLIVSGFGDMRSGEAIIQSMENDSLWSSVPAVKNHNVYVVKGDACSAFERAGVRMLDAVQLLAQILHPENFSRPMPHVLGDNYSEYLTSQTSSTSSELGTTLVAARDA
jgi:iron complex transport system substrate-binding protein